MSQQTSGTLLVESSGSEPMGHQILLLHKIMFILMILFLFLWNTWYVRLFKPLKILNIKQFEKENQCLVELLTTYVHTMALTCDKGSHVHIIGTWLQ